MINKVTNTHCRSKIIFFLLTLYKSLKKFPFRTFEPDFFHFYLFQRLSEKKRKMFFWGAPCRQDEHQVFPFMSRCCTFFLSPWFFIRDKSEANTFDVKHLKGLKSKNLPWQDSRRVPSLASTFVFWMSSSRKPACTETRVGF